MITQEIDSNRIKRHEKANCDTNSNIFSILHHTVQLALGLLYLRSLHFVFNLSNLPNKDHAMCQ